jgi:hypothetical protein
VDRFDAHGADNGNGLAVDDAYGVCGGFIGVRGRGREECDAEQHNARGRQGGAAEETVRIGEQRHAVILAITSPEGLAYTIRRRPGRRTWG